MIKVGIIGAGIIAQEHVPAFKKIDQIQVVGVSDIAEEKAKELADEFNVKAFTDHRDLLKEDIDAVYILTPPNVHKQHVLDSLNAGKHIFCEKPLAHTIQDAKEITAAVHKTDKIVFVGYVLHYFGSLKVLEELFKSEELGELRYCWIKRYVQFCPKDHWVNKKDISGGMAVESFTHEIDWVLSIGGNIKNICANYLNFQKELRIPDFCSMLINFDKGAGTAISTWAASFRGADAGIIGTKGTACMKDFTEVIFKPVDGEEQVIKSKDMDLFRLEDEDFIKCIENNEEPANNVDKALKAIEVAYAGYKSSEEHTYIQF